jgi:hypothetical protein
MGAQEVNLKTFNYTKADSVAIHFPKKKYKNIQEIVYPLLEGIETEHEKFRTIFRWITENIEYNRAAATVADADKIIRKNKAVCQGFSNLLKEMCDLAKIPCEVIVGYTKTELRDINKKLGKTDHAWNMVKLYGKNYLVDVTWATSKYNVVNRKFIKEFDEHYYLTPPDKFIIDHYPKDKKYQLLDKFVKEKTFIQTPIYYPDFFHVGIKEIYPYKGKFRWKKNKPLRIYVESPTNEIKTAGAFSNYDSYIQPLEIKKGDKPNEYYLDHVFLKEGKHDFMIYINGLLLVEYLVKVH